MQIIRVRLLETSSRLGFEIEHTPSLHIGVISTVQTGDDVKIPGHVYLKPISYVQISQ
jgi:hypothetical protein